MAEDHGLPGAPILVIDLRVVLGRNDAHAIVLHARSRGWANIAAPAAAKLGSESEDIATILGSVRCWDNAAGLAAVRN